MKPVNTTEKVFPGIFREVRIITIVLGTKTAILLFGLLSFIFLSNEKLTEWHQILGIWNRWDAKSYLSLANYGYTAVGERSVEIVFFPFYPLLIWLFGLLTNDSILSAFLVSLVASVFLGFLFFKLVEFDYSRKIAISSVWFLFIFPTSYFLHIPYTESLFLALVVGSFYFCRRKHWLFAGILGLAACATRINGLILCLALPFEIWEDWLENRKLNAKWLWLTIIPMGFIGYLLLNFYITGNIFTFLAVQRENWQKFLTLPWISLWKKTVSVITGTNPSTVMEGTFELVFVGIGLLGIVAGWRYLRKSYRVWMVASWLLFVSTSWILSVPRYTLTIFPLFILIAILSKNRLVNVLITTFSLIYLGIFISFFVRGQWAF